MLKFQVGDAVKISKVGKDTYRDDETNPYEVDGVIKATWGDGDPYTFSFDVNWSTGYGNSYRAVDLDFFNAIVENE